MRVPDSPWASSCSSTESATPRTVETTTSSTVVVPKVPRAEETSGYQLPAMSRPSRREVGEMTTGAPPTRAITHSPVDVEAGMGASLTPSAAGCRIHSIHSAATAADVSPHGRGLWRKTAPSGQIRHRVTSSR